MHTVHSDPTHVILAIMHLYVTVKGGGRKQKDEARRQGKGGDEVKGGGGDAENVAGSTGSGCGGTLARLHSVAMEFPRVACMPGEENLEHRWCAQRADIGPGGAAQQGCAGPIGLA